MFDTPPHVAAVLARHVPRKPRRVLDPAVGKAALLAPLWRRLKHHDSELVCIDTDPHAVATVRAQARKHAVRCQAVHHDFLTWSSCAQSGSFDCIIMNPPFAATRNQCRALDAFTLSAIGIPSLPKSIPLEAAFLIQAIPLLEHRGRLLAIVPCSIVMAESLQWLRSLLLSSGTLEFVYEFPPFTFPAVESRVYLIVFCKGPQQGRIELRRFDPERRLALPIAFPKRRYPSRLDYGFHFASAHIRALTRRAVLDWRPLGELARVFRGTVPSPPHHAPLVHSTNFRNGYWLPPTTPPVRGDCDQRRLRSGDLLVRRVGRASCRSFGLAPAIAGYHATDCVFVIRPGAAAPHALRLLFGVKLVTSFTWSAPLLERGTGARYLSKNSLTSLPIPVGAPDLFADDFVSFSHAHDARNPHTAGLAIAKAAAKLLFANGAEGGLGE